MYTCHLISNISELLPLFEIGYLEMANCFYLSTVYYHVLGNFEQTLCIRSCNEDVIFAKKSNYCTGSALFRGTLQVTQADLTEFTKPQVKLKNLLFLIKSSPPAPFSFFLFFFLKCPHYYSFNVLSLLSR